MLVGLSIRDFVLVRALDLDLGAGFTALTGETGAGKSVLLAALGFALGGRAQQSQIRSGADCASVTASFDPASDHPVRALLADKGFAIDGELVFRRLVKRGGAARAFLNDQPVSAALLEEAGSLLADVHGQHEGLGLLNPSRHRALIDAYGDCGSLLADVGAAWTRWRCAEEARKALEARIARAAAERVWLGHALDELDALAPGEGEAQKLALDRAAMQSGERVAETIDSAIQALARANVENALLQASRSVGRAMALPGMTGEGAGAEIAARLRAASEALERALIETGEARGALEAAGSACDFSADALEQSELRLFAIRAAARKHDLDPDQLPALRTRLRLQLEEIEHADGSLKAASEAEAAAQATWQAAAEKLSAKRQAVGKKLAKAVGEELAPLKLDKARFRVALTPRAEPGPAGLDDVSFEIATNAGSDFGALDRIASGGELARVALAISVCLAGASPGATLVFDEADAGVGGAVAAAVGERLARLGQSRQVLAITHSPQVAAAADRQWRISKAEAGGMTDTSVEVLKARARREEIARMLAGASVTREARAAAGKLLARA
jgi:DNA repair protein RecN (Recombination protein N)